MDTAARVFQTAAEKEAASSACAKMEFEKKCAEVPMSSQESETPAAAASMKSSPLKHRHDQIEDEIELEEMQQPAFKKAKMDQEPALGKNHLSAIRVCKFHPHYMFSRDNATLKNSHTAVFSIHLKV